MVYKSEMMDLQLPEIDKKTSQLFNLRAFVKKESTSHTNSPDKGP